MKRLHVIFNPHADGGRTSEKFDPVQRLITEHIAASGDTYEVTYKKTAYERHAVELVRESLNEGVDILVAVGGDGTLHEIANVLMTVPIDERPLLAVVPAGTGNDFAATVGLHKDLEQAVQTVFGGKNHAVDAMLVRDETGRTWYWINTMGIGFSGIMSVISHRIKLLKGFAKYIYAILLTLMFYLKTMKLNISLDDGESFDETAVMLAINNGPREGGGFPTVPTAVIDDGLITYMLARGMSGLRLFGFLPVVMKAKHLENTRYFTSGSSKKMTIVSDSDMVIHTDGELFGQLDSGIRRIEVEVLPGAVKILIPA